MDRGMSQGLLALRRRIPAEPLEALVNRRRLLENSPAGRHPVEAKANHWIKAVGDCGDFAKCVKAETMCEVTALRA
jgi:hypothetical protein